MFSLGCTGFSAKDFPAEVTSSFVSAFAKLKQKVIMRFDPTLIPDVPDNVIVSNWVPQQEILGEAFSDSLARIRQATLQMKLDELWLGYLGASSNGLIPNGYT